MPTYPEECSGDNVTTYMNSVSKGAKEHLVELWGSKFFDHTKSLTPDVSHSKGRGSEGGQIIPYYLMGVWTINYYYDCYGDCYGDS